jgi:hypothetical protein
MEEVHQQLVLRTAKQLVRDGENSVEAFRVACRAFAPLEPLSLPFLLWILTEVEEERTRQALL